MTDVSVIGLGAMGTALAEAFLAKGLKVTVWNRTSGKAGALTAKGAVEAGTVQQAIAASKLVVACLLVYDTVYEAFEPAKTALADRTLVNLTNGTPAQARAMAEWTAKQGADYLDGGIMAVPPMIGQPEALILYSGSQQAFTAHEKALAALGTAQYLGSDAGLAPLHDIALLTAMYGLFSGVTHAFALTGSEKVPAETFLPMLTGWLGAVMTWLPDMARRIDSGDYRSDVVSNLEMQAAAFDNFITASEEQEVSPELIAPMFQLMKKAVAAGYGDADQASLVEMIRRPPEPQKEQATG
ncbi:NAD(P)-dependent oxidoreductase [Mesorhizobium sp. ZC-5]|uniref:NAD(P)-dependent oxidoreductase n=1 Tax=Mesorhizobium sp. ZC-5 TaxID=2986066 RepID=UPI0021E7B8CF|nr:NAD(P)-binding domain-containing protein [Mesorhizobium sp. ZC-5]MCV3238733.1 NAD(P)-binding domain-containing protein [Mesorhizobium sp. ZC-5]